MRKPRPEVPIADEPPSADILTAYDQEHFVLYLRLLDAMGNMSRTRTWSSSTSSA